jgi:hypothetical protein
MSPEHLEAQMATEQMATLEMDERNEQIKQGVLEGVEAIKSDAAAGYEVMQVFATSVAQRVPDVTIEELHSMVIAVLEEIQRNCEHDNKSAEYFMKFGDPDRPSETVREMVERYAAADDS